MPTITARLLDKDMQATLSELTSGYHAGELSKREIPAKPDPIYIIEDNDQMVGYGVIWEYESGKQLIHKAEQDYFNPDEKYLERDFYLEIKNKTNIVFIEALDVLKEYEGNGYAKFFVDWVKAQYPNKRIYVYTIDKSRNFWFKQDFEVIGSTIWMSYN